MIARLWALLPFNIFVRDGVEYPVHQFQVDSQPPFFQVRGHLSH